MRKAIAVVLATTIAVSVAMIGCSKSKNDEKTTATTTVDGLINNQDSFEIAEEVVTDKNGETVTDKDGKPVTTQVMYKETTDKKGNKITVKVDDNGEIVTDKHKNPVTVATTTKKNNSSNSNNSGGSNKTTIVTLPEESTTEITTVDPSKDIVPKIDDSTKSASFTEDEIKVIEAMLDVPGIYSSNYENSSGVPLEAAKHAAVWMAQRENLNTKTYASGTIVLGLFKYFGQTVVNFKNECGSNSSITYNSENDTFTIPGAENEKQKVSITKVEEYSQKNNNNYYKVTASVSGCDKSSVVAVIQKNRLDSSLGFSIKAMRWS
ncbi:hypothetical protein [uncultured Eubacterium sp.]|uniref:hypothetical protein n=1 Tax=uncultured Eubacterium sp. TaxID=165185 RepID=UPI0025D677D4|nr:hypothetical protein [uncultured Eubacterium sp.]